MRTLSIAALALTAIALAAPADAGQRGHRGPNVRPVHPGVRPMPHPGVRHVQMRGPRWGGKVRGRWYGGTYAPGGWAAYRRPVRGWVLPSYWVAPSFYVSDWQRFNLWAPQPGHGWIRYYDDAVLVDRYGQVVDTREGIDWDRSDDGRYVAEDGDFYERFETRRADNGVGGAVIGGVAGGVAGNVLAGRGDRTAGTIIGAGAGAVAGALLDRAEDRGRDVPPPGAPYPEPGAGYPARGGDSPPAPYDDEPPVAPDDGYDYADHGPAGPPPVAYAPRAEQVQPYHYENGVRCQTACGTGYAGAAPTYPAPGYSTHHAPAPVVSHSSGYSTTTTSYGGGGYVAGGWYYPPATVTTVTVSTPVVTTTTVEEEIVTYTPARAKRVVRKAKARPRAKCYC